MLEGWNAYNVHAWKHVHVGVSRRRLLQFLDENTRVGFGGVCATKPRFTPRSRPAGTFVPVGARSPRGRGTRPRPLGWKYLTRIRTRLTRRFGNVPRAKDRNAVAPPNLTTLRFRLQDSCRRSENERPIQRRGAFYGPGIPAVLLGNGLGRFRSVVVTYLPGN